ncbi:MAG: hypothetical protein LBE09_06475 [Christensenellaceae bacterium]|nr:hypothetical protein [Christensenellaceae bacterium]
MYDDSRLVKILDAACGSGGMLSASFEATKHLSPMASLAPRAVLAVRSEEYKKIKKNLKN